MLALSLLVTPRTFAQSPEGAIVGTVNDSMGARVPGAHAEIESLASGVKREAMSNNRGEFTIEFLAPGGYRAMISKPGFDPAMASVNLATGFSQAVVVTLRPARRTESVSVEAGRSSLAAQPFDPTSNVIRMIISSKDLDSIPLAHRSFANIAYLAPMTQPVEPSDPTKARITAVSFAGSSGLNVDLSVDGGDNNDDWIGGLADLSFQFSNPPFRPSLLAVAGKYVAGGLSELAPPAVQHVRVDLYTPRHLSDRYTLL